MHHFPQLDDYVNIKFNFSMNYDQAGVVYHIMIEMKVANSKYGQNITARYIF